MNRQNVWCIEQTVFAQGTATMAIESRSLVSGVSPRVTLHLASSGCRLFGQFAEDTLQWR